jgi:aspartate-semialdehyde dehydrogenase
MMEKKDKIDVGILGATGSVGQKFIQLLENHPYFTVKEVAASDKSAGKKYIQAVSWFLDSRIPSDVANLEVKKCEVNLKSRVVFSGLDSRVAGKIESDFARAGYIVISNSKNHRFDEDVPLLIPDVNPDHLQILNRKKTEEGMIVTNPNCSAIGMVLALKPLYDNFGLEEVNVTTMQALSGAGFPGVASLEITDNVIPYIAGEEEKLEKEPLKILGAIVNNTIKFCDIKISAQCNRVPVTDGHLEAVQVRLKKKADVQEIISSWENFRAEPQKLKLPSAPAKPIYYFQEDEYPQPRLHRNLECGMAIAVGRLRECPILDYKFIVLAHNTIRGAAGGAILCAELMKAKGLLK